MFMAIPPPYASLPLMARPAKLDHLVIRALLPPGFPTLRQRVFAVAVEGETVGQLVTKAVGLGLGSPRQVRAAVHAMVQCANDNYVELKGR